MRGCDHVTHRGRGCEGPRGYMQPTRAGQWQWGQGGRGEGGGQHKAQGREEEGGDSRRSHQYKGWMESQLF